MFITLTTSNPSGEQVEKLDRFLVGLLPKLEQLPGVVGVYHYVRAEKHEDTVMILWRDVESVLAYREGPVVQEVIAFEKSIGVSARREGYEVKYPLAPR